MAVAAITALVAFVVGVVLQVRAPNDTRMVWSLATVAALLLLPLPWATVRGLNLYWGSAYAVFALWGTAGFFLQMVLHGLHWSAEASIQQSAQNWLLLGDQRHWELQHKHASRLYGRELLELANLMEGAWLVSFSIQLFLSGNEDLGFWCYAAISLILSLYCAFVPVCQLWIHVTNRNDNLSWRWHRLRDWVALARTVVVGMVVGWSLTVSLLLVHG